MAKEYSVGHRKRGARPKATRFVTSIHEFGTNKVADKVTSTDLPRREFVPLGKSIVGFNEAVARARRELYRIPSLYP